MTRSWHSIAPTEGHVSGARGSTNSGPSLCNSEYSLIRSTATWNMYGQVKISNSRSNSITIDCSSPTKRRIWVQVNYRGWQIIIILTMKRKLCPIIDANTSANPANDAEMLGDIKETTAIAPTRPADSRLKRIESHRLTKRNRKSINTSQ